MLRVAELLGVPISPRGLVRLLLAPGTGFPARLAGCEDHLGRRRGLKPGRLPGVAVALLLLLLLSAVAAAAEPRVHLTSPRPGWTTQRVVRIAGTVAPADGAHEVRLIFNGIPQSVALDHGVFEIDQVLAPGGNEIRIVAAGADGTAVASVWLHASVPPADLKVILTWDARDADVDLRILDPAGERCDFNHSGTAAGGRLDLDVSDGYGPEIFTQTHALPGNFRISARLFRGPPQRPVRCRIDVILREGRPDEERRIYRVVLTRPGEDTIVAELEAVGDA